MVLNEIGNYAELGSCAGLGSDEGSGTASDKILIKRKSLANVYQFSVDELREFFGKFYFAQNFPIPTSDSVLCLDMIESILFKCSYRHRWSRLRCFSVGSRRSEEFNQKSLDQDN